MDSNWSFLLDSEWLISPGSNKAKSQHSILRIDIDNYIENGSKENIFSKFSGVPFCL